MLRLGLFLIILIFNTVSYSQITERYWVPLPDNYNYCDLYVSDKLDLNEDGTYRCYYGICLIHHEEYGTYTMNKDTLFFTHVANACSGTLPYEADSNTYTLNAQGIFEINTVKVKRFPDPHNCNLLNTDMLFLYNNELYMRKTASNPFRIGQRATYTSESADKRRFIDLERDFTLLLVKQELGIY